MKQLHQLVLRSSQNGWLFGGALLGFALTLIVLLQVGERFAAVTQGMEPFDLQNDLTLTAIFTQLWLLGRSCHERCQILWTC